MKQARENPSIVDNWPEAGKFRRSIRFDFSIYLSIIVLALMTVTGYVMTGMYVKSTTQQVIEEALIRVRSYANTAGKLIIASEQPDALMLNNLLKRLTEDYPDAHWSGIAGRDDVFLAHTDMRKVIMTEKLEMISSVDVRELLDTDEGLHISGDTISISVPITENGVRVGTFAMASSTRRISQARSKSIRTVAAITLVMMLFGVPVTILVLNRKLRPMRVITDHLKQVSLENINIDIPITSRNEFGYLARTLSVMGRKLGQAQQDLIERERINRELEIAREIQANMLPHHCPEARTFQIACSYRSAREVGGDYYDFIEFDDRNLGIIVADVSGKSLPGMLVMLLTRDIIRRVARHIIEPAELLKAVNAELRENIKRGMFVTMFYGVLDKKTGSLTFASAGHNPVLKVSGNGGGCELIKSHGYPLGMLPTGQFASRIESTRVALSHGDWVIQYTDGINEARNGTAEEFGMERFTEIVTLKHQSAPGELVSAVIKGIESFAGDNPQYDDITLIALKWFGPSADNNVGVGETIKGVIGKCR